MVTPWSGFAWSSSEIRSILTCLPSIMIPPAALISSTAMNLPTMLGWPYTAPGPVSGSVLPILTVPSSWNALAGSAAMAATPATAIVTDLRYLMVFLLRVDTDTGPKSFPYASPR